MRCLFDIGKDKFLGTYDTLDHGLRNNIGSLGISDPPI